jgi:copper(I)-binding protein
MDRPATHPELPVLESMPTRRRAWRGLALLAIASVSAAHDFKLGPLVIDHPHATPTPAGASNGAVYFRTLKNTGSEADRLVAARSTIAASVEIHRSTMDGDVMRMRAVPSHDVPAHAELMLRHGGDTHLMLIDLKAPLRDGQCFPLWLRFEHAGEREVTVCVQTPRDRGALPQH